MREGKLFKIYIYIYRERERGREREREGGRESILRKGTLLREREREIAGRYNS